MISTKEITVYNLSNLPTADIDDFFELQEDFKIEDPARSAKLQMLILTRGFKYAFNAWKDESGKLWIIDAHQRKRVLKSLRKIGFIVPPIPYQLIQASSKKEAVEEIAAFNSSFASVNPDTELFKKYDIDLDTMNRFDLGIDFKVFEVPSVSLVNDSCDDPELLQDIFHSEIEDVAIEIHEKTVSKPGDIWLIGNHRLMCGDCTVRSNVKALMNGRLADIAITDPPYNVQYTGATEDKMKIQNDDMLNDDFYLFLRQSFNNLIDILSPGAAAYIFHADTEGENFRRAFTTSGFKFAQCCIWLKNQFAMGRQDYQWQHEPVLYGWKPGASHRWYSDRKQTTVWPFDKPKRNGIHPTMKPVALLCYPILNSSKPGDLCVDFFAGSGSTMIACQKTERICYSIDLDPKFVDASVRRFHETYPCVDIFLLRDGQTIAYGDSGIEI